MRMQVLYIVLPWVLNLLILFSFYRKNSDTNKQFWSWSFVGWLVVLGLTVAPAISWNSDGENSLDSVVYVLEQSWDQVYSALTHILRYIIPFAVYPLIVFWLKIWVSNTQNHQEQAAWSKHVHTQHILQQKQQAQLITFVLKVLILVFVFFDLLGKLNVRALM